jgi:hypothetical protein
MFNTTYYSIFYMPISMVIYVYYCHIISQTGILCVTNSMFEVRHKVWKRCVFLRMYCHNIFHGDGFNTHLWYANAKLVRMRLQTKSIKRGKSEVYTFPNNQNKISFEWQAVRRQGIYIIHNTEAGSGNKLCCKRQILLHILSVRL